MSRAILVIALSTSAPSIGAQTNGDFVELRRYPVHEGLRDRFLHYFEEHYLESQEVVGMRIWGQFRDLDRPNDFVWVRGYRSMEERLDGLQRFYSSPLWTETGAEAVTMLAGLVRNVHFLEPVAPEDRLASSHRRPVLLSEEPVDRARGVVVVEISAAGDDAAALVERIRSKRLDRLRQSGGTILGLYRTSDRPNNFPMLPFIEDQRVVVLFASFASHERYRAIREATDPAARPDEVLVLDPGKRSRMVHRRSP